MFRKSQSAVRNLFVRRLLSMHLGPSPSGRDREAGQISPSLTGLIYFNSLKKIDLPAGCQAGRRSLYRREDDGVVLALT